MYQSTYLNSNYLTTCLVSVWLPIFLSVCGCICPYLLFQLYSSLSIFFWLCSWIWNNFSGSSAFYALDLQMCFAPTRTFGRFLNFQQSKRDIFLLHFCSTAPHLPLWGSLPFDHQHWWKAPHFARFPSLTSRSQHLFSSEGLAVSFHKSEVWIPHFLRWSLHVLESNWENKRSNSSHLERYSRAMAPYVQTRVPLRTDLLGCE